MISHCQICLESHPDPKTICDACLRTTENIAKVHRITSQKHQEAISGSRAAARVTHVSAFKHQRWVTRPLDSD